MTLERQSKYSDEAAVAVKRFAEELLSIYRIDRATAVIALHNNTPGILDLKSILDELGPSKPH
jgi:hypothetical protein